MRLFCIESGFQSGAYNMALDEALLEWLRLQAEPVLIVRTYQWERSTLSVGVNQAMRDVQVLLALYEKRSGQGTCDLVRRPTGGRAILHGEDISFAFVTNAPDLLQCSLKASYATFSGMVQSALQCLGVAASPSIQAQNKDYLRSPSCFETHTPSDLLSMDGKKLAGSAQLRRLGGILQHGAAFLKPYGVTYAQFSEQLFQTVVEFAQATPEPFPLALVQPLHQQLEVAYLKASGEILASASTTSGSHLAPASP
jgi:lipoate-protein ligase A